MALGSYQSNRVSINDGDLPLFMETDRVASLNYNLYVDALRSSIWGNGLNGTSRYSGNAFTNVTSTVPIYGRIPARQNAQIGSYSDTLTVTITF